MRMIRPSHERNPKMKPWSWQVLYVLMSHEPIVQRVHWFSYVVLSPPASRQREKGSEYAGQRRQSKAVRLCDREMHQVEQEDRVRHRSGSESYRKRLLCGAL